MSGKMILIAAVADNGVIGRENKLPWERIPGDLPRFKRLTTDHAIIMGRKTYESFGSKPLSGRLNAIVSRRLEFNPGNYDNVFAADLERAIKRATAYRRDGVFFVIGGGDIYAQTIDRADELNITQLHLSYEGDVLFPKIDPAKFFLVKSEDHPEHGYSFDTWERIR